MAKITKVRRRPKPKKYKTPRSERRALKASKYSFYKRVKRKRQRVNYHLYIVSRRWYARRSRYYQNHSKECFVCKTTIKLTLHHKHYNSLGGELDNDLVPLCWDHHQDAHALADSDKSVTLREAHILYKKIYEATYNKRAVG